MTNASFDPETRYAQLGERVENQATRIADLDMRMRQGFTDIASQIRTLSDDVRGGSKTQWPIIIGFSSVTITVLGGLGFLALQPIKDNSGRLEAAIVRMAESSVSQKEMDWRTARGQEDRQRTEVAIKDLRQDQVPRGEHERVWSSYDQRFIDQQRQIDEVKQAQGSVYGQRDIILDLRERLDRIERQRLSAAP